MRKIAFKNGKNKRIKTVLNSSIETKLALLKHQFEISMLLIKDMLEDEVTQYAGERYSHKKPNKGRYNRWGTNPGSVWIGEEKVSIDVPRIYDNENRRNKSLGNYEKLRSIEPDEGRLLKAMLNGLSTNSYKGVVEQFVESRGLSRSKVSQRFIEESSKKLEEFSNRDLSVNNYVAVFIDGKYFYKEQIVIAIGITEDGRKVAMGFIQTTTENARSIKQLLANLIERGLKYDDGLLFVIDGSKGLYKAVKETFGNNSVIQRCQWHKRENVVSYLSDMHKDNYRKKMNKAYNAETYDEALRMLKSIHNELTMVNRNAANSLLEGLEETLTLHRLQLHEVFKKSFSTTNIIENVNSQIGRITRNVKYWKSSDINHNKLPLMKEKIINEVNRLKIN
jgi:transposase-like protein